jgi:hypothetical protein
MRSGAFFSGGVRGRLERQVVGAVGGAVAVVHVHEEREDDDREVRDDRRAHDHAEARVEAIRERAAHGGGQHRPRLARRLGDELEQDGEIADRQLAARAIGQRCLEVLADVLRAARAELIERPDLASRVADPAIHARQEAQPVLALLVEREQRELERQAFDRHRERVLHRLPDGDADALADQPLLDDLAAEQHADAEDAAAVLWVLELGHQNGAFFTDWMMRGKKSCFKLSHS